MAACLALLLTGVGRGQALAADFAPSVTQYAHASWRVQDGDLGGQANSIAQTADGYLWVGAESGLERYDGTRFRHWPLPAEKPVYAVRATRDGALWVARTNGLVRLKRGVATEFSGDGRFNDLREDRNGVVWAARTRGPPHGGGLCRVEASGIRCLGASDQQPCDYAGAIAQDAKGVFWIGSSTGVCRWGAGGGEIVGPSHNASDLFGVGAFAAEPDGAMLIGFVRSGPSLGLQRVTGTGAKPVAIGGFSGDDLKVTALLRDHQGALWIGTVDGGITHLSHGRVDRFTTSDGLSSNSVKALFEDREGSVWVATTGGVDRFHQHVVTAVTTREGLSTENVASVLARRDGSIWIGSIDGPDVLRDGVVRHLPASAGLPGHTITSMLEDHAGKLWLGVDTNLASYDGKTFRVIRGPHGSAFGTLVDLEEDRNHDIWVLSTGRPYRIFRVRDGVYLDEIHLAGGAIPHHMAAGPNGAIWITDQRSNIYVYDVRRVSTIASPSAGKRTDHLSVLRNNDAALASRDGLQYRRDGQWHLFDKAHGLPCNRINSATEDAEGTLWLRAQCGLILVAKPDLERALANPKEMLKVRLLDGVDGARPGEPSFMPAVSESPDGRLWFATDGVLLMADPRRVPINLLPPPVHVEQVIADHRRYLPQKGLALPALTRDVEFDYAGLSLVAPQKMHFRYRLSGVDDDWQDVGTRRAAFYMNLKPGRYRFQVIASNNDGVWNTTGDALAFSIRPAFYQTLWFRTLAAILLLGLVWLGLWLRVRYVTAEIETRLSERQAERFRIARELHDTLLQGFQGLLMRFQVVSDAIPKRSPAKPMMEAVLNRAEDVLVEGRDRVHDLRSAEDGMSPLFEEIERLVFGLERDGCGPIEVQYFGMSRPLDADAQREILAVAKEALTNACRHARARAIFCHVTFTGSHVQVICGDDGVGIDRATMSAGARPGHWGLTGMRERARQIDAAFRVESAPGRTRINLRLNTRLAYLRAIRRRLALSRPNKHPSTPN